MYVSLSLHIHHRMARCFAPCHPHSGCKLAEPPLSGNIIDFSVKGKEKANHTLALKGSTQKCISHFIHMSLVKASHTHDNAILQGGREVHFYYLPRSKSARNILPKIPMHYAMGYWWFLRSNYMGRNSVIFQGHWNENLPLSLKYLFYLLNDAWSSFNST